MRYLGRWFLLLVICAVGYAYRDNIRDAVAPYVGKDNHASDGFFDTLSEDAPVAAPGAPLSTSPKALVGNVYETGAEVTPLYGLRFVDETHVEILSDTKVVDSCRYSVLGKTVTVYGSHGTTTYEIAGNDLVFAQMHCTLSKL